jgi:hypothetical protein
MRHSTWPRLLTGLSTFCGRFSICRSPKRKRCGHASRVTRAEEMARSVQLRRIVGVLMIPRKDVTAVIIGLALAAGGLGEMSINGFSSGASAARRLGKHRATLSHWKRFWQDLLDLKDETYGKTDEAKAKYRRARINYLEKRRRKTHEAT